MSCSCSECNNAYWGGKCLYERIEAFRKAIAPTASRNLQDDYFLRVVAKMREREGRILVHDHQKAGAP